MTGSPSLSYSVVIPAHNSVETLGEAIASILEQTVPPADIFVIDDASTDDTVRLASEFSPAVTVVTQARTGPGGATTHGISLVKTPLFAGLDHDDKWLPEKAERQIDLLRRRPEIDAVFTHCRQFHHGQDVRPDAAPRQGWIRSTMMIRTERAREVGPVRDFPGSGDMVDWLGRAKEAGLEFVMLPEVLTLRRIIPTSLTFDNDEAIRQGYLRVAHDALRRRRARPAEPAPPKGK